MEKTERQVRRRQLVITMLKGQSWKEAARAEALPLRQAMAYRLVRAVRTRGEDALQDRRHGHPIKLRGEVRAFLETCCREVPCTSSPTLQAALRERFDLQVSVSQINRVRAALGVSNHSQKSWQEKNCSIRDLSLAHVG